MRNQISAALTDTERLQCLQSISDLKSSLPFLISLAPEERMLKRRLGMAGVGYVRECLNAAHQHPDVLPATFDVAEFEKDIRLIESLEPLMTKLNELAQMLNDTRLRLGQEAMDQAGVVYDSVKLHAKRNSELNQLVAQLKGFHQRKPGEALAKRVNTVAG